MAGCLPQFQPVLEHVIKAVSIDHHLAGECNYHPISICIIINGPLIDEIEMNTSVMFSTK